METDGGSTTSKVASMSDEEKLFALIALQNFDGTFQGGKQLADVIGVELKLITEGK